MKLCNDINLLSTNDYTETKKLALNYRCLYTAVVQLYQQTVHLIAVVSLWFSIASFLFEWGYFAHIQVNLPLPDEQNGRYT